MNPSVQDRLGSVVRALTGVILPALPDEASLAKEQTMLAIGQIQIILAQYDAMQSFEAEEASDYESMAQSIAETAIGGPETLSSVARLNECLALSHPNARQRTTELQEALDSVLVALAVDGDPYARDKVRSDVLAKGAARALKDRTWFAAMGFDSNYSGS